MATNRKGNHASEPYICSEAISAFRRTLLVNNAADTISDKGDESGGN